MDAAVKDGAVKHMMRFGGRARSVCEDAPEPSYSCRDEMRGPSTCSTARSVRRVLPPGTATLAGTEGIDGPPSNPYANIGRYAAKAMKKAAVSALGNRQASCSTRSIGHPV